MPIEEFPCPECGADVEMGLPRDATVKSIGTAPTAEPSDPATKARNIRCRNGHEFTVVFTF